MTRRSSRSRLDARALLLQRRSAVALDGESFDRSRSVPADARARVPVAGAPWDALWWPPRIHLAVFVHRVDGMSRRAVSAGARRRRRSRACRRHSSRDVPLDSRRGRSAALAAAGRRLPVAVAACQLRSGHRRRRLLQPRHDRRFDASLDEHGPSFYRQLFWESGVVGQVLYLEAEAAGARATGIGCFYDDAVHELLGLDGHAFQSLYHFTVGMPVEDARLTTEPGYPAAGINFSMMRGPSYAN